MAKRTKKASDIKREFSAGGVVYKEKEGQILWLVTKQGVLPKSSHPPNTWRLPKGWLDDEKEAVPGPYTRGEKRANEEVIKETALQEVREEGGVKVEIVKKIGTSRFFFNSIRGRVLKFVTLYLMKWIKDLPEGFGFETEEVAWLPFEKARKRLTYFGEKEMLDRARKALRSRI